MDINKNLISRNHTAKKRSRTDIKYIVVHYVGALGDAKANTDYYKSTDAGASADFFVGHTGDIWQANDYYNYYSWHCGGGRQGSGGGTHYGACTNANSIGIEMCVRKRSTGTMNATDKDWYFTDATIQAAAELVVCLMAELDIDIDHVIRHYDVTGKVCPNPFVYNTGAYHWDAFKKLCSRESGERGDVKYYRIRKSWEDAQSQIGAYTILDNARAGCLPGYTVYDCDGNAVYTAGCTSTGTQTADFADLSEPDAAAHLLDICRPIAAKYGLLPSVCTAQTILESGYCKTELAVRANNVCGMKCSLSGNTWAGSTWDGIRKANIKTAEQDKSGNVYYINADFRGYPCIEDSIADRCAYLLGALNGGSLRYDGITDCRDYRSQITLIRQGGYATDASYVSKICDIITRYDLDRYDGIVLQGQYIVQSGSFSVKANADKLVSRLRKVGFDGILKQDGDQYKVQCGVFSIRENAEKLVKQLKAAGFAAVV